MYYLEMEFREAIVSISNAFEAFSSTTTGAKSRFQWGGTIFALFLLILNRTRLSSRTQTTLLVLYLFTSFPEVLYKVLRGQFGCWVAFLAIAANLFFPQTFSVSRFVLFVIIPEWIADGLRDSILGGVFCLIIGILLVITKFGGPGGAANRGCNFHCFAYSLCIALLLFFPLLYLSWELGKH